MKLNVKETPRFNSWEEFFDKYLRLTDVEIENKTGIPRQVIYKIRKGGTKTPQKNTIRKFEDAFNITIINKNPDEIIIKKKFDYSIMLNEVEDVNLNLSSFPVITSVYAGNSPELFVPENIAEYVSLPYEKKENVFAVRVKGDSMNHKIDEGDIILVDMDKSITNGSIVIVRLKSGQHLIKRYREVSPGVFIFYSDNSNYEPRTIHKEEIETMYKVVGIWRNI